MSLVGAIALPLLAGLWLVTAGRRLSRRSAWSLALVVAVAALVLTALAIATDASVDRPWEIGRASCRERV